MCRNIRTLFNFEPPATDEKIRASGLQFVRKLRGFAHPSKANEYAFASAVDAATPRQNPIRMAESIEISKSRGQPQHQVSVRAVKRNGFSIQLATQNSKRTAPKPIAADRAR